MLGSLRYQVSYLSVLLYFPLYSKCIILLLKIIITLSLVRQEIFEEDLRIFFGIDIIYHNVIKYSRTYGEYKLKL